MQLALETAEVVGEVEVVHVPSHKFLSDQLITGEQETGDQAAELPALPHRGSGGPVPAATVSEVSEWLLPQRLSASPVVHHTFFRASRGSRDAAHADAHGNNSLPRDWLTLWETAAQA